MMSSPPLTRSAQQHPEGIARLCQLQVEQLALQVPAFKIWLVYWNQTGERQIFFHCEQNLEHKIQRSEENNFYETGQFPDECFSELPGEQEFFSFVESEYLALNSTTYHSNEPDDSTSSAPESIEIPSPVAGTIAHLYPFKQRNSRTSYLLLLAKAPLTAHQMQLAAHQMQLLEHYIQIHQEHLRQQAEIQLLEHLLQRAEHQLRSPLALISLHTENLYHALPTEPHKDQIALIRETVSKLTDSLSSLISCGQKMRLQTAPHNLIDIIRDVQSDLAPWIKEKNLRMIWGDTPVHLVVDRWQIQQVFHNLLHNAISFSPPESTISCQWQVFNQEILIAIADQGCGLTETDLQQLFTPFYSRRPGGTGLGLAIAQKIILDHHGHLWAENLAQGGAQFSISLPLGGSG
jgi:signal transduction histidine kinase